MNISQNPSVFFTVLLLKRTVLINFPFSVSNPVLNTYLYLNIITHNKLVYYIVFQKIKEGYQQEKFTKLQFHNIIYYFCVSFLYLNFNYRLMWII